MSPVGFIGVGAIGKPMAQRLLQWPAGLVVYDVAPQGVAELVALGAAEAASVADLAERCDAVCVMVRDDAQVGDVLDELLSAVKPPSVVICHSTVAPQTPPALAERAVAHGVAFVDAPVSGGAIGAVAGTLAIMVGSAESAYQQALPVLELMATKVVHAGEPGAGTRLKLARNLIQYVSFCAAGEAQRLAEAAGVDIGLLGDVVRHSDAVVGGPGMVMFRPDSGPLPADNPLAERFSHVRDLGAKDLGYAAALGAELGIDTAFTDLARTRLGAALGVPEEPEQ